MGSHDIEQNADPSCTVTKNDDCILKEILFFFTLGMFAAFLNNLIASQRTCRNISNHTVSAKIKCGLDKETQSMGTFPRTEHLATVECKALVKGGQSQDCMGSIRLCKVVGRLPEGDAQVRSRIQESRSVEWRL